jgi:hypothetical protein
LQKDFRDFLETEQRLLAGKKPFARSSDLLPYVALKSSMEMRTKIQHPRDVVLSFC